VVERLQTRHCRLHIRHTGPAEERRCWQGHLVVIAPRRDNSMDSRLAWEYFLYSKHASSIVNIINRAEISPGVAWQDADVTGSVADGGITKSKRRGLWPAPNGEVLGLEKVKWFLLPGLRR